MSPDTPSSDPHGQPYAGRDPDPAAGREAGPADPHAFDSAAAAQLTDAIGAADHAAFPWPPRNDAGVLGAFGRTWQGATFQPRGFFAAMPPDRSLGAALLYYLPLGILVAGGSLFWNTVGSTGVAHDTVLDSVGGAAALNPLVSFLLSPLILLLSLVVSAAVTHLLLKVFGAGRRGFSTTARVFAFAYSPQLFGLVPFIGMFIAVPWMIVISIIGLREAHRTTTGRAAAAVLIPAIIALFFIIIAWFIAAAGNLLDVPL